jgi:hypothetical protein
MADLRYDPRLSAVVGRDSSLTLFLSNILFWHQPGQDGKPRFAVRDFEGIYWLAKSAAEWERETLLTRRQVDRCVLALRDLKMITSKVMRFNGAPTMHLRFLHLEGRRAVVTADDLLKLYGGGPLAAPFAQNVQSTTYVLNTEETTDSFKVGDQSIAPPGDVAMAKKYGGNSSAEVLKAFQAAKAGPVVASKATPGGMYEVWRSAMPKYIEGVQFVAPFTLKEMGMCKTLVRSWGPDSPQILLFLIQHWIPFTKHCETDLAAFKTPARPTLPFLAAFAGHARNWYQVQITAPAKTVGAAKPLKQAVILAPAKKPGGLKLTFGKNVKPGYTSPHVGSKPLSSLHSPKVEGTADKAMTLQDLLDYKASKG